METNLSDSAERLMRVTSAVADTRRILTARGAVSKPEPDLSQKTLQEVAQHVRQRLDEAELELRDSRALHLALGDALLPFPSDRPSVLAKVEHLVAAWHSLEVENIRLRARLQEMRR